jgi:hypothetical protein
MQHMVLLFFYSRVHSQMRRKIILHQFSHTTLGTYFN